MQNYPTFKEALFFWLKLGFISFGGPAGQIAMMHAYLVEKRKWISEKRFLHALNYCMLLPGPEAQQLATYIGWLLHGTWGGLVAGGLFVLPSAFMLLGLSVIYVAFGQIPVVASLFWGLKPAVVAIVLLALLKIGKKSLLLPIHYAMAGLAFVCIFFFNVPFPLIILGAVALGAGLQYAMPQALQQSAQSAAKQAEDEGAYLINSLTSHRAIGFSAKLLGLQLLSGLVLWALPLLLFRSMSSEPSFWVGLSLFFTQAALVTFGGAYAVLPFVAQYAVEQLHWLSSLQMLDGLALGETTPGPLIIVLAFVGFMGAYNHFSGDYLAGALGLGATVYFTFLPSFLFIFMGAPIIEKTQHSRYAKAILGLITSAVVGVVLNLSIYLGKEVLFPGGSFSLQASNLLALGWMLASLVAMHRFKVGMITWIGISALFGMLAGMFM